MLRGFLPPSLRWPDQTDSIVVSAHNSIGGVGRAVRGDDDLEIGGRVILVKRVLDFLANAPLLVVSGDDERDAARDASLRHRAIPDHRERHQRAGITDIGVEHETDGAPERDLGHHDASKSAMARLSRSESQ